MRTLQFLNCTVHVYPHNGYLETKFHDGSIVKAFPNYDLNSFFTAENLGYGKDLIKMTIEHEISHTLICETAGLPYSPTLWSVAHNQETSTCIPIYQQYEEEAVVLAFQKYLNGKEIEKELVDFSRKNDVDLAALKIKALEIFATIYRS